MTICIGFIPNKQTAMLMQDSEVTYSGIALTQDIANKTHKISDNAIAGLIGNPAFGLEILEIFGNRLVGTHFELRTRLEEAYQTVRDRKFNLGVLKKYGFEHIREVSSPNVDTDLKKNIFAALENKDGFPVIIMLAYHLGSPGLYHVHYPGTGELENTSKMYQVAGSGSLSAANIIGGTLERYRWQSELNLEEAVLTLIDAGIASEKHIGVQRPFRISYVLREVPQGETEPQSSVKTLDTKMLNMIIHAKPHIKEEKVTQEAVGMLLKAKKTQATPEETVALADHLKSKIRLGVEFDNYFGII